MDKLFGIIGLARRAGKLAAGDSACRAAVKAGKVRLVLLACDAAENTGKRAYKYAKESASPLAVLPDGKESFGRALGQGHLSIACVLDAGFAKEIQRILKA